EQRIAFERCVHRGKIRDCLANRMRNKRQISQRKTLSGLPDLTVGPPRSIHAMEIDFDRLKNIGGAFRVKSHLLGGALSDSVQWKPIAFVLGAAHRRAPLETGEDVIAGDPTFCPGSWNLGRIQLVLGDKLADDR